MSMKRHINISLMYCQVSQRHLRKSHLKISKIICQIKDKQAAFSKYNMQCLNSPSSGNLIDIEKILQEVCIHISGSGLFISILKMMKRSC